MEDISIKTSIIIVSYNNSTVLQETLKSIYDEVDLSSTEIIVVDNNSTDDNIQMVNDNFPKINLIENKKNLGFANGCNLGAKNAQGKYLLFVNSDIIIKKNPISEMLKFYENEKKIGIVGCQLINKDGSLQPSYFRFPSLWMRFIQLSSLKKIILKFLPKVRDIKRKFFDVDFVSGAFLMIEKKFFFKIGCFDERYFMYLEDADLCYRSKLNGKRNILYNYSKIIHLNENHEKLNNPFVFYNLNKGQILFYKNNYSRIRFILFLIMSIFLFGLKYSLLFLKKGKKSSKHELKKIIKLYIKSF